MNIRFKSRGQFTSRNAFLDSSLLGSYDAELVFTIQIVLGIVLWRNPFHFR